MATYSVPNTFTAGTKASADEVNENFTYITNILDGMSAARYPFCINTGNRNSKGAEDLFSYKDALVTTKIGGSYDSVTYTTGGGVPSTISSSTSLTLVSTSYSSVIPAMSSYLTGSVSCATNSEASNHEAWHAFDKDEDTYWGSFVGVTTSYLAVGLGSRSVIRAYYLKTLTAASWTLQGSNDESIWTTLDTYSVAEASTVLRMLDTVGNYNTYRLNITGTDESILQIQIAEFDLYQQSDAGTLKVPETQVLYLGSSGLEAGKAFFRQEEQPAGKALYDAVLPTMTSNIVPDGYIISASSYTVNTPAYYAVDRQDDTYWEAADGATDVWFQVEVPNPIIAKVLKLTIGNHDTALDEVLINGTLSGSNNGATWYPICTIENLVWNYDNETKYFYFVDNATKYSYYRLTGDSPFASLAEFQLYTASDDGEYLLGEADEGSVWFKTSEPYEARVYTGNATWELYDLVPAGEADLDANGLITEVRTYQYDQNGLNINATTTKDSAGNVVTYDSYVSHFGETGYTILPNNTIFQWGTASSNESVIFPAAFPHKLFAITANAISDGTVSSNISKKSKTGFTLVNGKGSSTTSGVENYWFAVGW